MTTATTEKNAVTVDEAVAVLRPLFTREDLALWAIGDALNEMRLSDGTIAKVAQQLGRSVGTLRTREAVAREFALVAEDGCVARDTEVPWGVFAALLPLAPEKRLALYESRSPEEWKVDGMKDAVQRSSGAQIKGAAEGIQYSGGFKLGNVKVKGVLCADGSYAITIDSAASDAITTRPLPNQTVLSGQLVS